LTDIIPVKKLIRPHLPLLIEGALNISCNVELSDNLREVTIAFLDQLCDTFGKFLAKKHGDLLEKIIKVGFTIASEDCEDAEEDTEKPADFAVYMLLSCATEVPNTVSWPLFKANVVACWESGSVNARKAALKILGFVSESDALLDPIKDDVDELSDLLVTALKD
jgi:hypothetical protein